MAQPSLNEHLTCVAAPAIWLSPPTGRLGGGADGLYVADRRVLSRLVLTLDGAEPEPGEAVPRGADGARFTATAGDLEVTRIRTVTRDGGTELIRVRNAGSAPVTAVFAVDAAADLAAISDVKAGVAGEPARALAPGEAGGVARGVESVASVAASDLAHGVESAVPGAVGGTSGAGTAARAPATGAGDVPLRAGIPLTGPDGYEVLLEGGTHAQLSLAPGETFTTTLTVRATPPPVTGFRPAAPAGPPPWSAAPLTVRSADERLDALVAQGVADLGALLLADEGDVYCGAGSPWYLTLFGRDALWTARLALPLGHELAAGTLRALARHQGVRHDTGTEEEPGKIPHELRPAHTAGWLPPVYYGSVDATALFVITLAEAWRWGMPAAQVEALLPAADRALDWLAGFGEFVSYRGAPGKLVNQGWKDSSDGVQYADGRLATPPVALCEVQAYAYQAATLGAGLMEAFGRPGGERRRAWAAGLAERFRARFWVGGPGAPDGYPAIAVDGTGAPVDGPASNLGHLLGTGLLTPAEEDLVAARLADLDSGYGLRTLSDRCAGYDPLSYHLGSVWPHDTAIAILGLVRAGHPETAARLARGLICAAPFFGYRLPELFGGQAATVAPVPYPPACRPQAWAAAVAPALLTALLGLDADVPGGRLAIAPLPGFGALSARGLRVGAAALSVDVDAEGRATVTGSPPGVRVTRTP